MLSPRSAGLLLAYSSHVHGLMFHSTAVSKQWDTWGFVENGTWYAYYLITEVSAGEDILTSSHTLWR
eukprot:5037826-Prymnesium_polylepis.1